MRVSCHNGSQVGGLFMWNIHDLNEHFSSAATRQLEKTHIGANDRLWSEGAGRTKAVATVIGDSVEYGEEDNTQDGFDIHLINTCLIFILSATES